MSSPESQPLNRPTSPSPPGFLRRCRTTGSEPSHSPWRRPNPTFHGTVGGRVGRTRSSDVSPFERSGTNFITPHRRTYRYRRVDGNDDPVTAGRGDGDDDDDDDWMCDDDAFDDDGGELSREEVRKSSWLRDFLPRMEQLKPEEIHDPSVTALCPACKGGPGGSQWFRGFQPLLDHARTVRAKRVRLHRRFAEILDEELRARSGRPPVEAGEASHQAAGEKWLGLGGPDGEAGDRMVLWPPMVVVLNTRWAKDESSDKWVGMGNRDLMDYFKEYEPVKARNAYGSYGHSGASLLTFDSSVLGYHQAERLHNHFIQEGRGKYEWHKQKPWKQDTDKRPLYGYMAIKEEELNIFSTCSGDKQKLKYELKPYQMVVGNPLKEMHGSKEKKALLEIQIAKEIEQKAYLDGKLRQRGLEMEVTRRRFAEQSDEHNKEIESMNEYCEILRSKLRDSELALAMMQKQSCTSSLPSTGDDQGAASSTDLGNLMNRDGEHDKRDNEMDEIAEEKVYLGTNDDSGDKKKKRPLLQGSP